VTLPFAPPCRRHTQAADSHPPWRAQLDAAAPATVASLLIRSQARLDRLLFLRSSGLQGAAGSLKTLIDSREAAFEAKFGAYDSWRRARATVCGDGGAAGGGSGMAGDGEREDAG
jgi:hypothetical protein